jgi:hydrogen peroxide-dependent heme synthase
MSRRGEVFVSFAVFQGLPGALAESDRELAVKEAADLLDRWSDRVETRGAYSIAGFRADADLMFWWISQSPDHLQDLFVELRHTALGRALKPRENFVAVTRPAEFTRDHAPAFVQGKPPLHYICVYPYVRTTDWYLLPAEERSALLREHGMAGREFDDVQPNTTSAFGLGDFEWILTFEADELGRIVDLLRSLRATEARRYTKLEVPFFTGIRKDLAAAVADLP